MSDFLFKEEHPMAMARLVASIAPGGAMEPGLCPVRMAELAANQDDAFERSALARCLQEEALDRPYELQYAALAANDRGAAQLRAWQLARRGMPAKIRRMLAIVADLDVWPIGGTGWTAELVWSRRPIGQPVLFLRLSLDGEQHHLEAIDPLIWKPLVARHHETRGLIPSIDLREVWPAARRSSQAAPRMTRW